MYGLLDLMGDSGNGDPIQDMLNRLRSPDAVQTTPSAPPQASLPAPQAAPLPNDPQAPTERPSLLARVGHALSAAEGGVSNAIRPTAPAGYQGMLTPDEIASARPSLLHSLIGGPSAPSSDEAYRQNLDALVGRKQATLGLAQQARIMGARQSIMQQFPPPTSGSEQDVEQWANKVMPYLMAHGDYEGVKQLQPVVDQFAKNLHNRPYEPQLFRGPDGDLKYFDPSSNTQVPAGFQPVYKPGSQGLGTPQLFRGPKGDYVGVAPGDNDTLAKLSAAGYKPEITARTEFVQNATQARYNQTQMRGGVADYMKNTGDLRTKATALNEAEMVLANAQQSGDPTYYGPAISRFVQAVEQSKNLRYQLLQYYSKNLDPSFKGTFEQMRDRLTNGVITPRIMAGMLSQVRNMRTLTQGELESYRQQAVKQNDSLDDVLPTSDSFFQSSAPAAPGGATPAPTVATPSSAGRVVTVNGKKFVLPR